MKRKRVCQSLWAAALVVLSAGCVKEPYPGGGTGGSSGFTLTAVAESMSPEGVITRASDPKTAAECEIRTLHVFLFGPDGNYLGTREGHRIFQGYQQIGSPTLHIDAGGFPIRRRQPALRCMWWPMSNRGLSGQYRPRVIRKRSGTRRISMLFIISLRGVKTCRSSPKRGCRCSVWIRSI